MFYIVIAIAVLCFAASCLFRNDSMKLLAVNVLNGALNNSFTVEDHPTVGYNRRKSRPYLSPMVKKAVAALQKWRCAVCGEILDAAYEIDHIVPLSHGGSNEKSNLQALCPRDHRFKTAMESTK